MALSEIRIGPKKNEADILIALELITRKLNEIIREINALEELIGEDPNL